MAVCKSEWVFVHLSYKDELPPPEVHVVPQRQEGDASYWPGCTTPFTIWPPPPLPIGVTLLRNSNGKPTVVKHASLPMMIDLIQTYQPVPECSIRAVNQKPPPPPPLCCKVKYLHVSQNNTTISIQKTNKTPLSFLCWRIFCNPVIRLQPLSPPVSTWHHDAISQTGLYHCYLLGRGGGRNTIWVWANCKLSIFTALWILFFLFLCQSQFFWE